ncbi:hypothetical protein KKH23_09960 [Patescibacteria group bacterium]|nr:hypothetical protein [Patescibacteria group bacterium]
MKKVMKVFEASITPDDTLNNLLRVMIAAAVVMMVFKSFLRRRITLWITSPSGKTTVQLPLELALRVIRKKQWTATKVEPVRTVSRREALKILLHGDRSVLTDHGRKSHA